MAIAGTLVVNILARTEKFRKGITSARKSLKGFDKSTKQTSASLGALSKSLLAIAGPAILGRMFLSTARASDEIAKMSRRLGFNVEELQFWEFASRRAGIQQRTLTMAIQRLERRLGEAAKGMGEAQGALKDLNIDAKEFIKLAPHRQFEKIIEATRGIENQNEQLRIFFKLFDSEGVSLVQLLGENVAELREQFKQLGGATSKEGIAQATKFIDAMTNLRQASGTALERIVIDVAPGLTKVIDFFLRERKGFETFDEFVPGTQTRVGPRKPKATFRQRMRLGIKRQAERQAAGERVTARNPLTGVVTEGPARFQLPSRTILERPIPPPTARQQFFQQPRGGRRAPAIGEFGRLGRDIVSGSDLARSGRPLRGLLNSQVRNPFPRTEVDKKRIAEKQLKVAEEQLLWNKREVEEFRKFSREFNNQQQRLERIRAAESF